MHKWINVERGLYKDVQTGIFYQRLRRPGGNGKKSSDTWQSLFTDKITEARTRLDLRRAARQAGKLGLKVKTSDSKNEPTVNVVLDRYVKDGCPNAAGHQRGDPRYVEAAIPMLRENLGSLEISKLTQAQLDKYHTWRITQCKRGDGHRTTDLDVATLSVACSWAVRCELIDKNPIERHHKYVDSRDVRHAKEVSCADMKEAHEWAGEMFQDRRSESVAWQLLFACMFGNRTEELLSMRTDAEPEKPGWISTDGGTLYVRRCKNPKIENPTAAISPEHRQLLDAHKVWHTERYPESPWYFPGRDRTKAGSLDENALGQALRKRSAKAKAARTPHGCRAVYVKVRRSNGVSDAQIAIEINHTSGVATLEAVYGGVPPAWLAGSGPKMKWIPGEPAWAKIKPVEQPKTAAKA
jgi:integrase